MIEMVGIVAKTNKVEAINAAGTLTHWLQSRGVEVVLDDTLKTILKARCRALSDVARADMGILVVLGGDGTLLSAARLIGGSDVPILGVNLGGMGFLTAFSLDELYPFMQKFFSNDYETEERMMLSSTIIRNNAVLADYSILNDVVLAKAAIARLLDLETTIDNYYLTRFKADGLIISTPTGSTAYSMSAGGPIVFPSLRAIIVTPICPHTLTNRPILVPDSAQINITISPGNEDVFLTFDGQVGQRLKPHDQVSVRKADHSIRLIKSPFKDYFELLRTKLRWGER
ncbi:MAG: NAD(+)/NADH kinase [Deltaproteobacteria bacterium]|nr:NAD(+)/NADH kinase [Deltaproteobacteria bacterium]